VYLRKVKDRGASVRSILLTGSRSEYRYCNLTEYSRPDIACFLISLSVYSHRGSSIVSPAISLARFFIRFFLFFGINTP
jgi:hypothetical protein